MCEFVCLGVQHMRDCVCKMSICACLTGLPGLLVSDGWDGSSGLDFHVSNFIKKLKQKRKQDPDGN